MGSWETSVNAQLLRFFRDLHFPFVAGAGKSVLWCDQNFDIPVSETYCVG
jgi:hypothetical protein